MSKEEMTREDFEDTRLELSVPDAIDILKEIQEGLDMPSMIEEYVALTLAIEALQRES